MTNKILFLDIDGVFIPSRAYFMANQSKEIVTEFDPCVVGMVNDICKETGSKLVIHSSWVRSSLQFLEHKGEDMDTYKWMIHQGIKPQYFHEDHTAKWRFTGSRWMAIYDWLEDHREIGNNYIILDDELPTDDFIDDTIVTDFDEGLTVKQYLEILERFGSKKRLIFA